jgi:hypothetical protein
MDEKKAMPLRNLERMRKSKLLSPKPGNYDIK